MYKTGPSSSGNRAKWCFKSTIHGRNLCLWSRYVICIDKMSCDHRHSSRRFGYSIRGIPVCDQRIIVRGTRYTAIPVLSTAGIHDVFIGEGTMNGERFKNFVRDVLLPHLNPFNGINPRSVVIMDNASIHHVEEVIDLIEIQAGAKLCFFHHTPQTLTLLKVYLVKWKVLWNKTIKYFKHARHHEFFWEWYFLKSLQMTVVVISPAVVMTYNRIIILYMLN